MNVHELRYRVLRLKCNIKLYLSRKWELFRTPKDQRPVKKLIWQKFDEAQDQIITETVNKMFGSGTGDFDGLSSILDDSRHL